MSTPLAFQRIQTLNGIVDIPVYNVSDITNSSLRISTNKGIGCYKLSDPSLSPLRIMTPEGVRGINTTIESAPNLINLNGGTVMDGGTIMLENTPEYYFVRTRWAGTGLEFQVSLNPNSYYNFTGQFEIISSS